MTKEQIAATKEAIELLRQANKRQRECYKHGVYMDAAKPVWSAANYLWRSLPIEERD